MLNTISKCNLKHMYISAHENFKPCVLFQRNHGNERIYMYSEIITSIPIGSSHLHTWLCLLHKYQKVTCQTCDVFQFYKRELRKIEAFSKKFKYYSLQSFIFRECWCPTGTPWMGSIKLYILHTAGTCHMYANNISKQNQKSFNFPHFYLSWSSGQTHNLYACK